MRPIRGSVGNTSNRRPTSVSVPVATGVPHSLLPASFTEPVVVPEMTAASLAPAMVTVPTCSQARAYGRTPVNASAMAAW